jgi:hypothetical protein
MVGSGQDFHLKGVAGVTWTQGATSFSASKRFLDKMSFCELPLRQVVSDTLTGFLY